MAAMATMAAEKAAMEAEKKKQSTDAKPAAAAQPE
jgi:hypothetical protein